MKYLLMVFWWLVFVNTTTMKVICQNRNAKWYFGDPSSTQSSFIVKKPGGSNLYYVFTSNCFGLNNVPANPVLGVYYSIVDMNLAAGSGSVILKNALLQAPPVAEKLVGTKHCNG